MAHQQVLILYRGSLLAQGIESLLRKESAMDIASLRMRTEESPGGFAVEVTPDVIIVDTCDLGSRARQGILDLLEQHPKAKVVCVNPEDGRVEVYHKDQCIATKQEELVAAIRSA
ncbi:MAG: hypothetical protein Q7R39_17995 [Dehalococcoidia bacterium]|nr:hypothetical protein [Dehalococcoidia bacterium]